MTQLRSNKKKFTRKEKRAIKKEKIKALPKYKRFFRVVGKTILGFTVTGVLICGVGTGYAWYKYGDLITSSVSEGFEIAAGVTKDDFIERTSTIIYDVNGNVMKELKETEYAYPNFEEINPLFSEGIVAVEDERFYIHHGVDLYGTIRGITSTLKGNGTQGGSTITQQLVRNTILDTNEVSVKRKLKEQVVAQEIEKKFTKQEIIQYYLNNVYFGHGNYGIEPASNYYFGKEQSELTAGEVAVIIGITNNPSLFDPIKNPDNALAKRDRVLGKMLENGAITQDVYNTEIAKPITLSVTPRTIDNSVHGNDALTYALYKSTEELMESEGFIFQYLFETTEEQDAYNKLYNSEFERVRENIIRGGYTINTSINQDIQNRLEQTVNKEMADYTKKTENGLYKTQVAVTTIDNKTGEVLAIVGGRGQNEDYFNRAYQAVRQPGSAAKPIVSYANAFELGYTPQSKVVDSAVQGGPKNWYSGYKGSVTIRYALEQSINTVAYKLASEVGSDVFLEKLALMQFSHLSPNDANPIIGIGGFTNGTTSVEMASAYSTFTRNGNFIEPTNVRSIKNSITGEVLVTNDYNEVNIYREDAAYFTVDSLKSVMSDGTGKKAMPNNYPYVFGKTGTTNNSKDSYFAGGTPYYTTSVWVGYDTPATLSTGELNIPKAIFKEWNEILHSGKEKIDFTMPKSVTKKGNNLYSNIETYEDIQKKRQTKEQKRILKEQEMQDERLAKEDYRIVSGLTYEEEQKRENDVRFALDKAQAFTMVNLEYYDVWLEMITYAETLNKEVKHKSANASFSSEIASLKAKAKKTKEDMIAAEEDAKEKEERIAKEKEEKEKIQSEYIDIIANYVNLVLSNGFLTQTEFDDLTAKVTKLEELGVETITIDPNWLKKEEETVIEDTPIENETIPQDEENIEKEDEVQNQLTEDVSKSKNEEENIEVEGQNENSEVSI